MLEVAATGLGTRLLVFGSVLLLVALAETLRPRRRRRSGRRERWPANFALLALGAVLARVALPLTAVEAGARVAEHQGGLLGLAGLTHTWAGLLVAVVLLDLAIYVQHVLMHAVPVLWRLHRVHHADPDFDLSTGVRFHPLEILVSAGFKVVVVTALGAPPGAVVAFEVLLNASAMFNHANLRLPGGVDGWLRWLLVTPDMHRVHHSALGSEMSRNYGFALPWWDRLCGTYRAQPATGHETMRIGLIDVDDGRARRLTTLLAAPFRPAATAPLPDHVTVPR
jgi:sterol desaturase/sphingolipid hydroxylase (fatty acid hydroxylase superfamily)